MKTQYVTTADLLPLVKDLNSVYNGNLELLQSAIIKGSFYATFTDPYEREKLRPISDRLGKISSCFIRERKDHINEYDLEKFAMVVNTVYKGNLKYLLVELRDTADLLEILKSMKGTLKLSDAEIDSYIYNINVLIKAVKKVHSDEDVAEPLPAFEWRWYESN